MAGADDRIALRAARLRPLVAGIGEEPSMDPWDALEAGLIPEAWHDCLGGLEYVHLEDDLALAAACASVAQEIRARQWDALERLGAILATGKGGTVAEQVASLPPVKLVAAISAMVELGWHYRIDQEG